MTYKEKAEDFLVLCASGQVHEAYKKYIGTEFVHHNPYFAGDAQSLLKGMEENAITNPNKIFEIQRSAQDGNIVFVHSKVRMNQDLRGVTVVHIFRFENGYIAELWDIGQPVPENSLNENGMF
jgi:predicted SnoaL-like aldol condensation-catalyzing enzyme